MQIPGRIVPRQANAPKNFTTPTSSPKAITPVVPFFPGRIYQCRYSNWKHDPAPLLFIMGSDPFYTHALNIHYLGAWQGALMRIILTIRNSNKIVDGYTLYRYMKARSYGIIKVSYRKYFTKYLLGRLVSPGISQMEIPSPIQLLVGNDFVKKLNAMLRPTVLNKVTIRNEEVAAEIDDANIEAEQAKRGYT